MSASAPPPPAYYVRDLVEMLCEQPSTQECRERWHDIFTDAFDHEELGYERHNRPLKVPPGSGPKDHPGAVPWIERTIRRRDLIEWFERFREERPDFLFNPPYEHPEIPPPPQPKPIRDPKRQEAAEKAFHRAVRKLGARPFVIPFKEPKQKDDWFEVIRDCIRDFEREFHYTPSEGQIWHRLHANPPRGWEIKPVKRGEVDCLQLDGEKDLTREGLRQRYKRLYPR